MLPRFAWRALALSFVAVVACSAADTSWPFASQAIPPAALAPARGPLAVEPPEASRPIRLLVGGDLLPHEPSLVDPERLVAALAPLGPLFATADRVVANYETTTADERIDTRQYRLGFAAPPAWMAGLAKAGIGALSIANNHACDLGNKGLLATLDAADECGEVALGGDAHDGWTPKILAERDGHKVCGLAWTTFFNGGACGGIGKSKGQRLAVAPLDKKGDARIGRALLRARKEGCDATVAIVHGGNEYAQQTEAVLDQARRAAESGADAVVIHHPHIASPLETRRTRDGRTVPIFASVGNLVSNQGASWKLPMFPVLRTDRRLVCVNAWTRLGVLADLEWSFPGAARRERPVLRYGFHLVWIENEHATDRQAPRPRITVRALDPTADRPTIARLSADPVGPVSLFADPCWIESSGKSCR